jgi:hypothetical protein
MDGYPDLFVTNDGGPNYVYHNKHDGTFEEIGLVSGASLSAEGQERAGMGVDIRDFDRDGRPDIVITNFEEEGAGLYWNEGDKGFTDIAWSAGVAQPTHDRVGWGTAFFDLDNDGWLDLFFANGHVYPQMDVAKRGAPYRQALVLLRNNRNRTFSDVTEVSGLGKLPLASRRGAAFGDVNNDGKLDILILNVGEPPTLLINRTESSNHAVLFRLVGTKSNKSAIGARMVIHDGDAIQSNEVRSGSSYLSQNDLRLHFGLGSATVIPSAEIFWPSGGRDTLKDVAADFIYTVVEGEGITQKTPFAGQATPESAPGKRP